MPENKKKSPALFIHTGMSNFIKPDFIMLSKKYHVRDFQYHATKNIFKHLRDQLHLFFWLCLYIWNARFVFVWFADYHAYLPILFARILKKKSFVALGGYDVAHIPELNYGSYKNKYRGAISSFSMRNATCVLPLSDNLQEEAHARVPTARIKVLYTGFDSGKFFHTGEKKQELVLTVGICDTQQRIILKGIDFFIKLASALPNYRFVAVGVSRNAKNYLENLPGNLTLYEFLAGQELLQLFQEAKVYGQFSMREGLPTAVCEAMLCECIPVGFKNGGIPIAMGDCGFLIDDKDFEAARSAIEKSMKMGSELGKRARKRIIDNFSLQRRENELLSIVADGDKSAQS